MQDYEQIILKRLTLFFNLLKINKIDFANKLNISKQNINRIFKSLKSLSQYNEQLSLMGCNLNWLYSGNGPVVLNNKLGIQIINNSPCLDDNGYLISYIVRKRILIWILFNFDSLESFYNLSKCNLVLELSEENLSMEYENIVETELLEQLYKFGCNLKWIFRNQNDIEVSPYNKNDYGIKLKNEKCGKENYINFINFKLDNTGKN